MSDATRRAAALLVGNLIVRLAIAAEVHEYEVAERVYEIGSDQFWRDVDARAEAFASPSS